VRRTYCGHDNPDDYLFCGVCGSPLGESSTPVSEATENSRKNSKTVYSQLIRKQESSPLDPLDPPAETLRENASAESNLPNSMPAPVPLQQEPAAFVSGTSLLGLDGPPTQSEVTYLLEDEKDVGRGKALLALALILVLAAAGWWQVRQRGGMPWVMSQLHALGSPRTNAPSQRAGESAANPEGKVENSQTKAESAQPQAPAPQAQAPAMNPDADESAKLSSEGSSPSAAEAASNQQQQSASNVPHGSEPAKDGNTVNRDRFPNEEATATHAPGSVPEQAVKRQPGGEDESAASKPPARNEVERASKVTEPVSSDKDDETARLAEKYLYGSGVPQDCSRAMGLLQPAANSSNAKAQTLLGAMYATGHCVPRDLPSSYHWFAQALRQQPKNIWLEKNLETVWNQMNSSQKQLAMRMSNYPQR
jgi:hypothetical protein